MTNSRRPRRIGRAKVRYTAIAWLRYLGTGRSFAAPDLVSWRPSTIHQRSPMRLKLVPSVRPAKFLSRIGARKRHHEPIPDQGSAPVGAKARVFPSRADQTKP